MATNLSLTLIPQNTGNILTGSPFSYTSLAFDGNNNKSGTQTNYCTTGNYGTPGPVYPWIGKDFGVGNSQIIGGAKIYNYNSIYYDQANTGGNGYPIYVWLIASNNLITTVNDASTVLLGYSCLRADTNTRTPITVYSSDTVTPYRFVAIALGHYTSVSASFQNYFLAQVEFYTTP